MPEDPLTENLRAAVAGAHSLDESLAVFGSCNLEVSNFYAGFIRTLNGSYGALSLFFPEAAPGDFTFPAWFLSDPQDECHLYYEKDQSFGVLWAVRDGKRTELISAVVKTGVIGSDVSVYAPAERVRCLVGVIEAQRRFTKAVNARAEEARKLLSSQ